MAETLPGDARPDNAGGLRVCEGFDQVWWLVQTGAVIPHGWKLSLAFPRRKLGCALVPAPALIALLPASAGAATHPTCKRAGSETVRQNAFARVYKVGSKLYGCRRATGKRTLLYEAYDDDYTSSAFWGDVRLNGRFVAWSWGTYDISCKADCPPGYNPRNSGISVFDLRRRRGRTVTPTNPVGGALVVSRGGGLAWLTRGPSGGPADLHVSLRLSDDRVIDSGDIDPKSLRVELTIISWVRDGVERFVRLR
jgi:hypothetical protein